METDMRRSNIVFHLLVLLFSCVPSVVRAALVETENGMLKDDQMFEYMMERLIPEGIATLVAFIAVSVGVFILVRSLIRRIPAETDDVPWHPLDAKNQQLPERDK